MYLKSGNKLTIQQKYTPMTTFLSPVQKCNHRSFSASSLNHKQSAITFSGSLRDQIRLDSFKKNVINDSKLNKTTISRANIKVHTEQIPKTDDQRNEIRELNYQVSRLKEEIHKCKFTQSRLNRQHDEDILLITRQSQLILELEKELALKKTTIQKEKQCDCYASDKYIITIKNLELKIKNLEDEKRQFKEQIRSLIVKQQELKLQLKKSDEKISQEFNQNKKFQNMMYEQKNKNVQKQNKKEQKRIKKFDQKSFEQEQLSKKGSLLLIRESNPKNDDLKRYYDYLKKIRNRQIEKIESILNE